MRRRLVILLAVGSNLAACASTCAPNHGTVDVPGTEQKFDPVGALPEVGAFVGSGARLESFRAVHVRSDGTIDLQAPYHRDVPAQQEAARRATRWQP